MLSSVTVVLAVLLLLGQVAVPPPPPAMPPPAQAAPLPTPAAPVVPAPDPASTAFSGEAGLLLVPIKPTAVLDYELVIRTLQMAISKDSDAARQAAAKGWRVFKATPADSKGNTIYIHLMLPAVPGFDYRPSLLVDTLVQDLAPELLPKYLDSFAGPPSLLDLTEFAHMAAEPLAPPGVLKPEAKKPG